MHERASRYRRAGLLFTFLDGFTTIVIEINYVFRVRSKKKTIELSLYPNACGIDYGHAPSVLCLQINKGIKWYGTTYLAPLVRHVCRSCAYEPLLGGNESCSAAACLYSNCIAYSLDYTCGCRHPQLIAGPVAVHS